MVGADSRPRAPELTAGNQSRWRSDAPWQLAVPWIFGRGYWNTRYQRRNRITSRMTRVSVWSHLVCRAVPEALDIIRPDQQKMPAVGEAIRAIAAAGPSTDRVMTMSEASPDISTPN